MSTFHIAVTKKTKKNRNLVIKLLQNHPEDQLTRIREQLVQYACEGDIETQIRRIEELSTYLVVRHRDTEWHPEARKLLERITENLFIEERLDTFITLFRRALGATDYLSIEMIHLEKGLEAGLELGAINLGRLMFISVFFDIAGGTIERSIQFCLYLFEAYRDGQQALFDSWMKIQDLGMTEIRNDADINWIERALPTFSEKTKLGFFGLAVLLWSMNVPPGGKIDHARKWLDQIIRHLDTNPLAREMWVPICGVISDTIRDNFPSYTPHQYRFQALKEGFEDEYAAQWALDMLLKKSRDPRNLFPLIGIVTNEQWESIDRQNTGLQERRKRFEQQKAVTIEWIKREQPRLQRVMEQKRAAIRERPKYGLRVKGADHIDIEISLLHYAGFRSVIFYPEDHVFPNTRIELLQRLRTPHLVAHSGEIADLTVCNLDHIYRTEANRRELPEADLYHLLLEFTIIDIMHRIIVEGKGFREKKGEGEETGDRPRERKGPRPHIRRLQTNQKASTEAHERAKQVMGWTLPEGITFVAARYRNATIEYDYPTEAIGVYTDEDLFEQGGS